MSERESCDWGDAMFTHFWLAAALAVAPIPTGAKAPIPIATFQFAAIETLEKDAYRIVRSMPMPDKETAVKQMQDELKNVLGESGWDGIDVKKPSTGYIVFDEKNPEKSYGFLVISVTDEKKFLAILGQFGKSQSPDNDVVPVEGMTGIYQLRGKNADAAPKHVRIVNGLAYLGFNAPIDAFSADKLIAPEKIIDPKETAKVAVTVRVNKLPRDWIAKGMNALDQSNVDVRQTVSRNASVALAKALDDSVKFLHRYTDTILNDGETFGLRLRYDDDLVYEFFLKGKSGTTLATDIASRKPTTNRYAGLITTDSVAGMTVKLPFFNDDLRSLGSKLVTETYRELGEKDPPSADLKPLLDKLVPALASTVKSGQFDLAAALNGPDTRGGYSAVLGIALDNAVGLTPDIKALIAKSADGVVEWDAHEAEGVKIHTANVVPLLPGDMKKPLGNGASCHFAMTKTGVILAIGRESLGEVKRAISLKAAPAAVVDMKVNPAKLAKFSSRINPGAGEQIGMMLGTTDRLGSINSLSVTGGEELRISINSGIALFAGVFASGRDTSSQFQPVAPAPPPPVKP